MVWLWALLVWGCTRSAPPQRPDIILLTVDTLRVDHVGAYNPESPAQTPSMDRLAQQGIQFTNAWSPISVTGPAFCSLHTGLLPGSHEVVINIFRGGTPLAQRHTTLAEHLQHYGYDTGAFVSGFTLREQLGLSQGFQTYDDPPERRNARNRAGRKTADAALEWLSHQKGPIFMWYHTFDPHGPLRRWSSPASSDPRWQRDADALNTIARYQRISGISDPNFYAGRYATAVQSADRQIGRILDGLEQAGRLENAIVILTADHGESFDERVLWFDHGTTPYAEQLHIPLIIKLPRSVRAGEHIDAMVGLADVAPSLLEWMGLENLSRVDGSAQILHGQGTGLMTGESSHCKKEQGPTCTPIGARGKLYSARDEQHTLIRRPLPSGVSYELYDRISDPGERTAMAGLPIPGHLRAAVDAMAAVREQMDLPEPNTAATTVDSDEMEALRALGYIDDESDEDGASSETHAH